MTKKIVNMGDSDFAANGGLLIRPNGDCEYWQLADDDMESMGGEVYTFTPDKCTFVNGILSDNPYHPELNAWFADSIDSIAQTCGQDRQALIDALCSSDIRARARAYEDIGYYHGFINLDTYPMQLTQAQANRRYCNIPRH